MCWYVCACRWVRPHQQQHPSTTTASHVPCTFTGPPSGYHNIQEKFNDLVHNGGRLHFAHSVPETDLTNHPRVHAAAADDDDGYAMGEEAGMVFFSIHSQGKLPIGMYRYVYAVCFAMQSTIHIVHMIVACLIYPLTLVGTQANLHGEQTSMVTRVHMEGFYRQTFTFSNLQLMVIN